jgi:hypothetical protein
MVVHYLAETCPTSPRGRDSHDKGSLRPAAPPTSRRIGSGYARAPLGLRHFIRSVCRGGVLGLEAYEDRCDYATKRALRSAEVPL